MSLSRTVSLHRAVSLRRAAVRLHRAVSLHGGCGRLRDRGSATAELAAAVPALMLLLLASLTGVNGVACKLRCIDAAREAALATARGEAGQPPARRAAPDDAEIDIRSEGEMVHVVVRARVHPLGQHVPGFVVAGEAAAVMEPSQ